MEKVLYFDVEYANAKNKSICQLGLLSEYYPYNHISSLFEAVLEDGRITEEESDSLIQIINSILSPVESLKEQISCVQNKYVCLSGNFSHG